MLAGSLMDYAMPRASDMVNYITELSEVPASSHPLGIRPAGEGGTVPALGVVINAVVDGCAWNSASATSKMPATPSGSGAPSRCARPLDGGSALRNKLPAG